MGSWVYQPQSGPDGADGKSAYEVAKENGFPGTEQEWLDSLQGEDGIPGSEGAEGPPGPPRDSLYGDLQPADPSQPSYDDSWLLGGETGWVLTKASNADRDAEWAAPAPAPVAVPVGTIQMWAMLTPPDGWLLCDGSVIDKALYPELHGLLEADGFLYGGDVNGAMIPDFARRVPFGDVPGQTGGAETVTLTAEQMPSHDHAVGLNDGGHQHSAISTAGAGPNSNASWTVGGASAGGASTFGWTGNNGANIRVLTDGKWDYSRNTGGGKAHENMPPYLTVNFIIKHD